MTTVTLSYSEPHVVAAHHVTPRMRRITLGGDGLDRFRPVAPDQQVKRAVAFTGYWRYQLTHDDALTADDIADSSDDT
ncbi:siderophore-interacting protein [Phytoactinopolyspora limicola]|uniref:siderophore-interacting protein n=1 Tax=Phytoactinopolyspora limicola TaxID=2715536 RepID=UPI001409367A|nr:siderophore-interacting protein [Phytoactinopolyspora limicola]